MKFFRPLFFLLALVLTACSSVRVMTDYDTKKDFNQYKTFAFYKKGIDQAKISDLDKRRILHAIETEMLAKGFTKSNKPAILVSIFTKSRNRVDVSSPIGYRDPFWYPMYYNNFNSVQVSKYTEGTLFIDFIDAKDNKLLWQGIGTGALHANNAHKKIEKINEFVKEIIAKYPPKKD